MRVHTQSVGVIFVAKVDPLQPDPCLPSPNLKNNNLPTPVIVERLDFFLSGYNHSIAVFLSSGFRDGFPLHYEGDPSCSDANNLISAIKNPYVVDGKISKELKAGRLAGPFRTRPFDPFRIFPLGVVPKKIPGEFRLIHHLSYPRGSSVNDGISPDHTSVSYATISDAIGHIKAAGGGCFLAKTDVKNAFRIIPIRPMDYYLLGVRWKLFYYYDRCMPMGCSSSCKTFETLSTAMEWIAQSKLRINHIIHLLDDFLIIAKSESLCQDQLHSFLELCSYLGIPIAPEKTCGPATTLSFAGIELDSVSFEARLPLDKIDNFFLQDFWDSSDKLGLFTDAAGSLGFGAVFGKKWCYRKWPDNWLHQNIALLEFYPLVLSLYLWGHHMKNRSILFLTDNEALVYVINKQSCKDKNLMFFVRKLVLIFL